MVGLPARGKTHLARKVARYLSWLGHRARVFNVGGYRRARLGAVQPASFFDPDNPDARDARSRVALEAMDDLLEWLKGDGSEPTADAASAGAPPGVRGARGERPHGVDDAPAVAIYDATNTARSQRAMVVERCRAAGVGYVFLESICDDASVIESNIRETKLHSPDYEGMDPERAAADFRERIAHYERIYEPVADDEGSYLKIIDFGQKVVAYKIEGHLESRLVAFLLRSHASRRVVWLTRHGESLYNLSGRIGGNPDLSTRGEGYARALARFLPERVGQGRPPLVWTSTLKRSMQTARHLPWEATSLRALDEIHAGTCDGMTYQQIERQLPDEFQARARDKLRYRYPRGESYEDVIQRLEPIIIELERQERSVLLVGHNAVVRAIYAYFMDWPPEVCPHLDVPLHTVIELTPSAYGCEERRYALETDL